MNCNTLGKRIREARIKKTVHPATARRNGKYWANVSGRNRAGHKNAQSKKFHQNHRAP